MSFLLGVLLELIWRLDEAIEAWEGQSWIWFWWLPGTDCPGTVQALHSGQPVSLEDKCPLSHWAAEDRWTGQVGEWTPSLFPFPPSSLLALGLSTRPPAPL